MEFTDSTHLLEAVRLGLGVALTRRSIADHGLERGEIVPALPHECLHTSSYYALLPQGARPKAEVEAFVGWVQAQCHKCVNAWPAITPSAA
jgi:LysR family glycine cleavage system transcriptional activator